MATRAGSRVAGRNVIGDTTTERRRTLPGRDVTAITVRIRGSEIVVAIDVALRAGRACEVEAGKRPAGGTMVKFSVGPFRNGMTRRAGRRGGGKTRFDVVRDIASKRRRAVPSRQMTAHAVGGAQCVGVIDMA